MKTIVLNPQAAKSPDKLTEPLRTAIADAPLPETVSASILAGDSCLKALRTWRGLTQAELAKRSGINQGYISEIENRSKTGAAETLSKLADALDVPPAWLG